MSRGPGADPWERRAVPLAAALLAALLLQGLAFIGESSQTSDEAVHIAAGYSYLETADFRLNPEHPPLIKEWAALPLLPLRLSFPWGTLWDQGEEWNIGRIFVHENRLANDTILLVGRLQVLLLSLLLGACLFLWGRVLFGARGALLALALYVLDPNVVAHSSLITTDLGITLFMFLTVAALWWWSEAPSPRRLLACGAALGAAFASKYTSFWLLPILAVLFAVLYRLRTPLPERPLWPSARPAATPRGRVLALLRLAAALAVAGAVVVILSYGVVGIRAYLVGLDRGIRHSAGGHHSYLLGRYSEDGWWWYFLFAYAVKTPIGTLLLVAAAVVAWARGRRLRAKDDLFLAVPIVLLILITCVWKVNIGLRHLLPMYPFLYLFAGRLAPRPATSAPPAGRPRARVLVPAAVVLCLAWNGVEAARILPYHLAYFNQLVGGPANGHLVLLDSNLDWGQSAKALRRTVEKERVPIIYCAYSGNSDPWYYGVRYQYAPGSGNLDVSKQRPVLVPDDAPRELLAVSAMVLHSVQFSDTEVWAPLRDKPAIAQPGYSTFLYDITRSPGAHAYLAMLYLNFGMVELADHEARRTLRLDPANAPALAVLEHLKGSSPPGGR